MNFRVWKAASNIEAARLWFQSWEKMQGVSALRKEEEDFIMEVEICDGMHAKVAPAAMVVAHSGRREEGDTSADGQPLDAHADCRG